MHRSRACQQAPPDLLRRLRTGGPPMSTAPGGTQPPAPASSVRSADGTTIAYRQAGDGPGVVLIHGSGQSSDLTSLARELSDTFTVYVPERRGRGGSGPCTSGHSLQQEIEDLRGAPGPHARAQRLRAQRPPSSRSRPPGHALPSPGWRSTSRPWSSTASPTPHGCPVTNAKWPQAGSPPPWSPS
jgi:hypothetical protein